MITADTCILRRPLERAVVDEWGVKVFTMPNGNLTGPQQVKRVIDNLDAVVRASAIQGPGIYILMPDRIGSSDVTHEWARRSHNSR